MEDYSDWCMEDFLQVEEMKKAFLKIESPMCKFPPIYGTLDMPILE
jgi:hypothetical protein